MKASGGQAGLFRRVRLSGWPVLPGFEGGDFGPPLSLLRDGGAPRFGLSLPRDSRLAHPPQLVGADSHAAAALGRTHEIAPERLIRMARPAVQER